MPLGKTALYYLKNPKARTIRLRQQKRYDSGKGSTGRTRKSINTYHRALAVWRTANRSKKAAAQKKNGGNPVDATHRKDGSIVFGDRKNNRGNEVRKRNKPSNILGSRKFFKKEKGRTVNLKVKRKKK